MPPKRPVNTQPVQRSTRDGPKIAPAQVAGERAAKAARKAADKSAHAVVAEDGTVDQEALNQALTPHQQELLAHEAREEEQEQLKQRLHLTCHSTLYRSRLPH